MKEKYYVVANTISKWKIDNAFENYLSYLADKSEFWKRIYVAFYKLVSYKYYMKGVELARSEIERQWDTIEEGIRENLNKKTLVRDLIYSLHRFGTSFEEYFIYKFYERNSLGRNSFNNLKLQYGYCQLVNDKGVRNLFEDKGALYEKLKPYYKRDLVVVYGVKEKNNLEDFLSKHSSFIYKPLKGHSGKGITIFKDYPNGKSFYEEMIGNGAFVLEELIEQGKELAKIHPESINTVRIVTFKEKEDVKVVGCALRMGIGKATVDNAGSGGIYASIDAKYGFVNSIATDNVNHHYSIHPDTGCKIVGLELPQWKQALASVKEMAAICGGATVIAWDLAYSNKGWLVIEGNDVGEPYLLQAPLQIGIKAKLIKLIDFFVQS